MTITSALPGTFRALVVALMLLTTGLCGSCGLCANFEVQRLQCPDGRLDAVLYQRDCGATTDFSTQVAVVPTGGELPDAPANVFIAVADGAEPRASWGGPPATIEWQGEHSIVVRYHSKSTVLRSNEQVIVSTGWFEKDSVTISYATSDDVGGGGRTRAGDAQRAEEAEARGLVGQLSPSTIGYDHRNRIPRLRVVGVAADRLVSIGPNATPSLIDGLTDPERAVAAHLVLCRIWYPGPLFSEEQLDPGDTVVGVRYRVQGLRWTISGGDGSVVVDRESLKETIRGWCRHVPPAFRSPACQEAS